MIDLSIVIVSYNVRALLLECLDSIMHSPVRLKARAGSRQVDAPSVEVIVIDSASTDETPKSIRGKYKWVTLIEPGENVGFPRGNNLGIEASTGRYVFVLNPDTRIIGDALAQVLAFMDAHPDVGVLGPQLLNEDNTVQSSRRRFPTLLTAFLESTWLEPIAPRAVLDHYYARDIPDTLTADVDWVTGAALVVRRDVIEQVGGMDEGFFMYSEELDWQYRIKQAGWRIVYFPDAQVVHYGGKSSEQVIALRHIHFQTSKIRYFRKHWGRLAGATLRIFMLLSYFLQILLEGAKALVGHRRQMRLERINTYMQVLRSGLRGA